MNSKFRTLFILLLFLTSCSSLLKSRYGFNKQFDFTTKESYMVFLQNKKNFEITNVIFPDSNSRSAFLESIMRDSLSVYYGCLINDSVELVKTNELRDNLSCMGKILQDINFGEAELSKNDSSLFIKSQFKKYQFNFLINEEQLNINHFNKKLKIVMLYSYALGTYFDGTFNEVRKFHDTHKGSTELYIITLDDVSRLK